MSLFRFQLKIYFKHVVLDLGWNFSIFHLMRKTCEKAYLVFISFGETFCDASNTSSFERTKNHREWRMQSLTDTTLTYSEMPTITMFCGFNAMECPLLPISFYFCWQMLHSCQIASRWKKQWNSTRYCFSKGVNKGVFLIIHSASAYKTPLPIPRHHNNCIDICCGARAELLL